MAAGEYCLRWDQFQLSFATAFGLLRASGTLVDMTLCCDNGGHIGAHQLVMAACSPYFSQLIRDSKCQNLVFFMRDVRPQTLRALVDFVYCGSVVVDERDLADFLRLAEALQIKGLSAGCEESSVCRPADDKLSSSLQTDSLPVASSSDSTGAGGSVNGAAAADVCGAAAADDVCGGGAAGCEAGGGGGVKVACAAADGRTPDGSPLAVTAVDKSGRQATRPPRLPVPPVCRSYSGDQGAPDIVKLESCDVTEENSFDCLSAAPTVPTQLQQQLQQPAIDTCSAVSLSLSPHVNSDHREAPAPQLAADGTLYSAPLLKDGPPPLHLDLHRSQRRHHHQQQRLYRYQQQQQQQQQQPALTNSRSPSVPSAPPQVFICKYCGRFYSSRVSLLHHVKVHIGLTRCRLCSRVTSTVSHLRRHLSQMHALSSDQINALVPTRRITSL